MSSFNIIHLGDGNAVDLGAHLAGGWGPAQILNMEPGASRALGASDAEFCVFVIEGQGTVTMEGHVEQLDTGKAITLMKGGEATVASNTPMQLFVASLPA